MSATTPAKNKLFNPELLTDYMDEFDQLYLYEVSCLQAELLELQTHIRRNKQRLMVIFEGRDAAGKGGAIMRFTQHLNPRHYDVVALDKPTETQKGQWYFQRYLKHLPDPGGITFFDRSWYNRAVVEPVMSYCTPEQHEAFMKQVNTVEKLLTDDGIILVKFWYSINYEEQQKRFGERRKNPLKRWKLSPTDLAASTKWDEFTKYKVSMFEKTSTKNCPWVIIKGNVKKQARLESMRYLLSLFEYKDKGFTGQRLTPDPNIASIYSAETRTWSTEKGPAKT